MKDFGVTWVGEMSSRQEEVATAEVTATQGPKSFAKEKDAHEILKKFRSVKCQYKFSSMGLRVLPCHIHTRKITRTAVGVTQTPATCHRSRRIVK